jgi:hypothetical protein
MSEESSKAQRFLRKAVELDAHARQASDDGRAIFSKLADLYRRIAMRAQPSPFAGASDQEIEDLAARMAGSSHRTE